MADRHNLQLRLSPSRVDAVKGVIYGATVAMAGVRAEGKWVMLDAAGDVTYDAEKCVRKLPVYTDAETLSTLLAACAASPRVKSRENHDDSVGARAGYCDNFAMDGGKVCGDVTLFDAYRNRSLVLETAAKTPDQIGLSIDMLPTFELTSDRALMRIVQLEAVDIVDAGAITPGGLLCSVIPPRHRLDTAQPIKPEPGEKLEIQPTPKMPDAPATPPADTLAAQVAALAAGLKTCMDGQAAIMARLTAAAPVVSDADKDGMSAIRAENLKLSKEITTIREKQLAEERERTLMGLRATPEQRVKLAASSPAEIVDALKNAGYLALVATHAETMKCSKTAAHTAIREKNPQAYRDYLDSKGIVREVDRRRVA